MNTRIITTLGLLAGMLCCCAVQGDGSDHCCSVCGDRETHKVCRLVAEEKSVEVICWGSKVEEFCVPGPSCPGCEHCECVECTDPKGEICSQPKTFVWKEWIPATCSKIFTRKKLMKKVVTKKVPSYKWVVEDLCQPCEAKVEPVKAAAGENIPAPPKVAGAKLIPAMP